ncbi:flavin-containing monooxygenase [Orrella marina]|uniref:Monooxygenase n=1 Tax=Orrella marina TaxID=2163011 RepID=A0A2R4XGF7_9BURK|nr:NAD(P)-binding domain-containing protein [Orrella marina]AWB32773.1 monooxygenase [Orrella marina]
MSANQSACPSQQSDQLPVCIIGAGSSGLCAAKALQQRGVRFDCFESGSAIGGMWRYENDNGLSSAYRSLHIDTSRQNLGYSDFPIPDHYPDYLSHYEVIEYLEAFVAHFGLYPLITFNTSVVDVSPDADGNWLVTLDDGTSRRYRAVVVANGHLWDPRMPAFPGSFDGEAIHSHHYRTAAPYEGKNVLVVGIGNSAVDIAVDVCKNARQTFLSTRRSAWILPKYIMGIPTDRWGTFFTKRLRLPTKWSRVLVHRLAYLVTGDQARFGVPHPGHPIWKEHATLSQELLPYCGHGWIKVKPDIKLLDGKSVVFKDETRQEIDAIIYATGYRSTFPFLKPDVFKIEDGQAALYRRMVPLSAPGLFMLGLIQPIGPTIPLVQVQATWLARVLDGSMQLPAQGVMQAEVDAHQNKIASQYVGSARYTLEVDGLTYRRQLSTDVRYGKAGQS